MAPDRVQAGLRWMASASICIAGRIDPSNGGVGGAADEGGFSIPGRSQPMLIDIGTLKIRTLL
jgi:hypothetical protein